MLGQTVIEIAESETGITIRTKEGNTFYIPGGVAVIPTGGIISSNELALISFKHHEDRFIRHATRRPLPPNVVYVHGQFICDFCKLDRSTCGYEPENPQNCEGHHLHNYVGKTDEEVPY